MNDQAVFKKIRKVLEFVWNSPYSSFYRNKYSKLGINLIKDINSMDDFRKLPFLTRDEILKTNPYDRFFLPKEDIRGSVQSSTTTGGKELLIFLKGRNPHPASKFFVKKALELKIKSVMLLIPPTATWVAKNRLDFSHPSIIKYRGNIYNLVDTAKLVKVLKIEALSGPSSVLEKAIPFLKEENALDQIRFVSTGGEYLPPLRFNALKHAFKNASFRFNYHMTESSPNSFSCDFLSSQPDNIVHPLSFYKYYEIMSPSRESELVITDLTAKTEFPLLRYKSGDMVKMYQEKCPCGRSLKMKLFGRIGKDVVGLNGHYLYREQIDQAIYPFGRYLDSSDWRLIVKKKKFKLKLILKKRFIKKSKEIELMLKKEIGNQISPLEIEFVESFEGTPTKQVSIMVI